MIVYTAIFADYDHLRSPRVINAAHTYTCICNPWIPVPAPWQVEVKPMMGTPRRSSRHYKILSHKVFPKAKFTVWHGGNVQLLTDPNRLLDIMGGKDIAVLRHPDRRSVYDEANACIGWKKDHPHIIRTQMARYKKEGFTGTPLSAAFLIVRRHTDKIAALNELWWKEVKKGSVRDQLSFDYACWKIGIKPAIIPGGIYRGPNYIRHAVHKR